jgi:hypothetical protein
MEWDENVENYIRRKLDLSFVAFSLASNIHQTRFQGSLSRDAQN